MLIEWKIYLKLYLLYFIIYYISFEKLAGAKTLISIIIFEFWKLLKNKYRNCWYEHIVLISESILSNISCPNCNLFAFSNSNDNGSHIKLPHENEKFLLSLNEDKTYSN